MSKGVDSITYWNANEHGIAIQKSDIIQLKYFQNKFLNIMIIKSIFDPQIFFQNIICIQHIKHFSQYWEF